MLLPASALGQTLPAPIILQQATGAPVTAQDDLSLQVSQDGQRLDEQPPDVRATFSAVWGDQAAVHWIQERNAALAGGQAPIGPRIAFLHQGTPAVPATRDAIASFVVGLRAAGYSPGKDLQIEWRFAGAQLERLPALADELVALKPSAIVAATLSEAIALRHATSSIPIVMAQALDPVGSGLVDSLEHPGGNVTGLTISGGNASKLFLLKQALPNATRVAVLVPNVTGGPTPAIAEISAAAPDLGMKLHVFELRDWDELTAAFATAMTEQADAVLLAGGNGDGVLFIPNWARIAALATEDHLPVMYVNRQGADAGGLMGYALAVPPIYEGVAGYVDKILRGARPEELPVVPATDAEFVINLKAAQAIDLTIPPAVLDQATEILR
jgi:putative ABC transport system substrate-binding protein